MRLRFDDPAGFERTCLAAAGGGAAAAVCAGWTGHAADLLTWAAAAALVVAVALVVTSRDEVPSLPGIAAALALATLAGVSARGIPSLAELLGTVLPRDPTAAAAGAVLGLWLGCASAPLHLRIDPDRIERRFASLLPRLDGELLRLCERAMAARAELLRKAPREVGPELRRVADRIALAALDRAERRSGGAREELLDRVAWLERACSALAPAEGAPVSSDRPLGARHGQGVR